MDECVLEILRSDAGKQRQILEDHLLALRMQNLMIPGQQSYEDFDLASLRSRDASINCASKVILITITLSPWNAGTETHDLVLRVVPPVRKDRTFSRSVWTLA